MLNKKNTLKTWNCFICQKDNFLFMDMNDIDFLEGSFNSNFDCVRQGIRTKSPRTKPPWTKSPRQNPPGQNLPLDKISLDKIPQYILYLFDSIIL